MANNVLINTLPDIVPPTIPSKYAGMGVEYGYNPPAVEELRLYLNGFPKEGKSTFVSSIPKTIIFDTEKGDISVIRGRATYFNTAKYGFPAMSSVIQELIKDGASNSREFNYVVFDTVDGWLGYELLKFCEEEGLTDIYKTDTRRVWSMMQTRICNTLVQLQSVGYGWIVVGHQRWEEFKNPGTGQMIQRPRQILAPSIHERILSMSEIFGEISSIVETEPITAETRLEDGSTMQYTTGTKEEKNFYFRIVNILGETGSARGVPSMGGKIRLPLVGGWDGFKLEYEKCVAEAKKQIGETK